MRELPEAIGAVGGFFYLYDCLAACIGYNLPPQAVLYCAPFLIFGFAAYLQATRRHK